MKKSVFLALVIVVLALPSFALADTIFPFVQITNDVSPNVSSQLQVEVNAVADNPNQVSFKFTNAIGVASNISEIYFKDGVLLGIAEIYSSSTVEFTQGATPPNLPGGEKVGFVATAAFSAQAANPSAHKGINQSGDWVAIVFNLQSGGTLDDVLDELNKKELCIGLHVQAINGETLSASFVNSPTPVPEPSLILLLGLGMGAAFIASVRMKKN
jgi:hypothetical protein